MERKRRNVRMKTAWTGNLKVRERSRQAGIGTYRVARRLKQGDKFRLVFERCAVNDARLVRSGPCDAAHCMILATTF
eukprot:9112741-Pyramimonas_sp.AAC.1